MSNDHDDKVGYRKPPVAHRFSKTRQPSRRRGRRSPVKPSDLLQYLTSALDQTIQITKKGKLTKVNALDAVIQQLFVKTLQGGANDQRKLLELLIKSGYFDFAETVAELQREHEAELAELQELQQVSDFAVNWYREELEHACTVGAAVVSAHAACTCGAAAAFNPLYPLLRDLLGDEYPYGGAGQLLGRAGDSFTATKQPNPACTTAHPEDPLVIDEGVETRQVDDDDPFYSGMIG